MHTTHDLWDKQRYMGSSHTPNLVTIGQEVPELLLIGPFHTLHAARATRQAPAQMSLVAIIFYRMGLPESENSVNLGCILQKICFFQKRQTYSH